MYTSTEKTDANIGIWLYSTTISQTKNYLQLKTETGYILRKPLKNCGHLATIPLVKLQKLLHFTKPSTLRKTSKMEILITTEKLKAIIQALEEDSSSEITGRSYHSDIFHLEKQKCQFLDTLKNWHTNIGATSMTKQLSLINLTESESILLSRLDKKINK